MNYQEEYNKLLVENGKLREEITRLKRGNVIIPAKRIQDLKDSILLLFDEFVDKIVDIWQVQSRVRDLVNVFHKMSTSIVK